MRILFLIIPVCVVMACRHPGSEPETVKLSHDSILSREQMIDILTDIHIIESAFVLKRKKASVNREMADFYYDHLFGKYKISRTRFLQNLEFYKQDPEQFSRIYGEVINNLERKRKSEGSE